MNIDNKNLVNNIKIPICSANVYMINSVIRTFCSATTGITVWFKISVLIGIDNNISRESGSHENIGHRNHSFEKQLLMEKFNDCVADRP
jgi:hypothetical protein